MKSNYLLQLKEDRRYASSVVRRGTLSKEAHYIQPNKLNKEVDDEDKEEEDKNNNETANEMEATEIEDINTDYVGRNRERPPTPPKKENRQVTPEDSAVVAQAIQQDEEKKQQQELPPTTRTRYQIRGEILPKYKHRRGVGKKQWSNRNNLQKREYQIWVCCKKNRFKIFLKNCLDKNKSNTGRAVTTTLPPPIIMEDNHKEHFLYVLKIND